MLQFAWLSILLTIVGVLSLLWKGRYIYRLFLKLTACETVEKKWLYKWLLQKINSAKTQPDIEEKHEKVCPDCGSLIGHDNKEIVTVKDVSGHELMVIHRDCILKTKRRVFVYDKPFLRKKKVLRVGKLRNLWKLSGSKHELCVKSPRFMFINEVVPDGIIYSLKIPREVKPIEGKEKESMLLKTSTLDAEMLRAYKEGLWGEEAYLSTFEASSKIENPYIYFVGFDTLARIYVGTSPPKELRKRLEAGWKRTN